jgi:hypothetical protein
MVCISSKELAAHRGVATAIVAHEKGYQVMRHAPVLLITMVGLLAFVNSCKDFGTSLATTGTSGTYSYKDFNLTGVQIASGILVLRGSDSLLTGELRIEQQVIVFEGRVQESTRIELFEVQRIPRTVLLGVKDDGTIRGDVYFDTGARPAPIREGTFRAERIGN